MSIILHELEWSNWFSYGEDNKLVIDSNSLSQVKGVNGNGKSSIPYIIQEVLYGKNSKGVKKNNIPNRFLDSPTVSAKLTFSVDGHSYLVDMQRKSSLKLNLYKDGEDISSHTSTETYKTIEHILGVDFKTFCQLTYQSSNSSLEFLTATDTNRKKFLVSLFDLTEYIEIYEHIKLVCKDSQREIDTIKGKVSVLAAWVDKNKNYTAPNLTHKEVPESPRDLEDELARLKLELRDIEQINSKINTNNQYKKLLNELDKSYLAKSMDKPPAPVAPPGALEKKAVLEHSKAEYVKSGKALSALGDVCPTCKQDIDKTTLEGILAGYRENITEINAKLVVVADALDAHKAEMLEYNRAIGDYNNYKKIVADFEKYSNYIDEELSDTILDAQGIKDQIASIDLEISRINKEIRDSISHNSKVDSEASKAQLIQNQLLEYTESLAAESAILQEKNSLYNKLIVLRDCFSTNGLISYKIESLVIDLEELINKYLATLSNGRFRLRFTLEGDKLNIEINDNGNSVDIESLSSGELGRVNMSALLAIRSIFTKGGSKINLLFLDEIMGVLDEEGKQSLIDLLLEESGLNTFIVSHEFEHPLVPYITVVKENNISRVIDGEL